MQELEKKIAMGGLAKQRHLHGLENNSTEIISSLNDEISELKQKLGE